MINNAPNGLIVSCLCYISDELIDEAIVSKGKTEFHFSKNMLRIAACIGVVLMLSVAILKIAYRNNNVADTEPASSMTLDEVEKSVYAEYLPNLIENGYSFDSAGIYNQNVFSASFFTAASNVSIRIEQYSAELHDKCIVDTEHMDALMNCDPIFYANQFNMECMKYVTVKKTAADLFVVQFSVAENGYVAKYLIDATTQDEITRVIEFIYLCYK